MGEGGEGWPDPLGIAALRIFAIAPTKASGDFCFWECLIRACVGACFSSFCCGGSGAAAVYDAPRIKHAWGFVAKLRKKKIYLANQQSCSS